MAVDETEFWALVRRLRHEREAKAADVELDDEGNPIEPEPPFTVTVWGHEVEATEMPSSPKKYLKWVGQNPGWLVKGQHSRTHHEATVYAADGKKKPGQEQPDHRKGDPKESEQDKEHWSVQAILTADGTVYAHFWAAWMTTKGKTLFKSATYWDKFSEERDLATKAGEFDEWLRILAPAGAPKEKAAKAEEDPLDHMRAELETGEWIG